MAVIWTEFIKRSTRSIARLMLAFVMTHNMCFAEEEEKKEEKKGGLCRKKERKEKPEVSVV